MARSRLLSPCQPSSSTFPFSPFFMTVFMSPPTILPYSLPYFHCVVDYARPAAVTVALLHSPRIGPYPDLYLTLHSQSCLRHPSSLPGLPSVGRFAMARGASRVKLALSSLFLSCDVTGLWRRDDSSQFLPSSSHCPLQQG